MSLLRVKLSELSVHFRLSYDKSYTTQDWMIESLRRLRTGGKPEQFIALDKINLTVSEGDIVGVVGPNGSGKSTLLRTISGIFSPSSGTVETFGKISSLLSLGTGFNRRLSGLENIRFHGLLLGMTHDAIDQAIPAIIEFANIGKFIDVPMKYYSSGMMSRLSFAIVLAMRPKILLIDEIFSVGDIEFRQKSEEAMDQLLQHATCQMIVTHNLKFVREHCNRAIYIRKGKLCGDGAPDEIVDQYMKEAERTKNITAQA